MSDHPALEINGLRFRYPGAPGLTVDVPRLRLERAGQLLLTAGSGRGKSTLLYLIAGLIEPHDGGVRIDGTAIHSLSGAARDRFRGRHVGMIFQTFNLLHGFSAVENVMAALMFSGVPRSEHRARAGELLWKLGIERPEADPDRLSVGQQQRVAVARAVACAPALVLADEPTASLDPENAAGAMDLIQKVCRDAGAALLCVSHDPAMRGRFERRESLDELAGTREAVPVGGVA
ncbi:MAG: ATP-binding cassette domain-containing protein [Phycisphaerales bacterium]